MHFQGGPMPLRATLPASIPSLVSAASCTMAKPVTAPPVHHGSARTLNKGIARSGCRLRWCAERQQRRGRSPERWQLQQPPIASVHQVPTAAGRHAQSVRGNEWMRRRFRQAPPLRLRWGCTTRSIQPSSQLPSRTARCLKLDRAAVPNSRQQPQGSRPRPAGNVNWEGP